MCTNSNHRKKQPWSCLLFVFFRSLDAVEVDTAAGLLADDGEGDTDMDGPCIGYADEIAECYGADYYDYGHDLCVEQLEDYTGDCLAGWEVYLACFSMLDCEEVDSEDDEPACAAEFAAIEAACD